MSATTTIDPVERHDGPDVRQDGYGPPLGPGAAQQGGEPRRPGWRPLLATALVAAVVSAGVAVPVTRAQLDGQTPVSQVLQVEGGSAAFEAIAQAVSPSVAQVEVVTRNGQGEGSAVIYREDGYLITNNHVVESARQVTVTLPDGTSARAAVVGTDPGSDLAVIKIDATGLPVPAFAAQAPTVGETAVAIGSPFGLDGSVTAGIVSALNRSIGTSQAPLIDMIQTDASINPGNSGGALVNGDGEVMGINTAILSPTGTNNGIGFAIPIATARGIADQLIADGSVDHAYLGVQGQTIDPRTAEQYGLGVTEGAVLAEVVPGGPADEAGLEPGDVVTGVDGEAVTAMPELAARLQRHQPGDTVELTVVRQGAERDVVVTLGAPPAQAAG